MSRGLRQGWLVLVMLFVGSSGLIAWFLTWSVGWGDLGQPTRLAALGADVFFLNVPELVRRGPPRMVVVRLEEPVELVPYHFTAANLSAPQLIEQWAVVLKAPLVFNAGQFDNKWQHLGLLKGEGQWLSTLRKPAWLGLLVSGPIDGGVWGRIVDLEYVPVDSIMPRYQHAVQSMMLVDEDARIRVRQSDLAACRMLVAEDKRGRLLIIASEGAITLHDLASWLPNSNLGIVRAMNLDGGIEAQLAITTPELNLTLYGQYGTESTVFEPRAQMVRYPLPAVIAVKNPVSLQ